jgi:GNAT superfamily N-acetyltransferase
MEGRRGRRKIVVSLEDSQTEPWLKDGNWEDSPAPDGSFIAKHGNKPIAALRIYPRDLITPGITISALGIGQVFVSEPERRGGIGTLLIEETASWASKHKYSALVIHSEDNNDFLSKSGFVILSPSGEKWIWARPTIGGLRLFKSDWYLLPGDHF